MLFSSSIFVFGFLPICLLFYYIIPKSRRKIRNLFLFIVSLGFYAWGEPVFVLIMIMSILANYIFGLLVDKYNDNKIISKRIIIVMLILNLGVLCIFKYSGFVVENLNSMFNLNIGNPNISLPIGISFFTFQAISYVIDVYRRRDIDGDIIRAQRNPINVGLYIALFPQLIAGPIVRYKTVAQQINHRDENFDDFSEGVKRFILGLSKKVLISNNLALIADKAFSIAPNEISISFIWLGAISYCMQIFFDFAGYSDMAIGLGKMFGFHFLENFNYPFISKSVSEFWQRWHISLGSWFRDYVYFPLGGSKKGTSRTIINLAIVWFLTGFWHGANWNCIAWGMYFFIFIFIEKFLIKKNNKLKRVSFLGHIYTLVVFITGLVIFRCTSIPSALDYLKSMIGLNGNVWINDLTILYIKEFWVFIAAGVLFSMPVADVIKRRFINKIDDFSFIRKCFFVSIYAGMYMGIFIIAMSYIVKGAYNPFIYFNF